MALKVVRVAMQLWPFVRESFRMAEFVSKTSSELAKLKVDVSVVAPLTNPARRIYETLRKENKCANMEDVFSKPLLIGGNETRVKILEAPFFPAFPVYFIENDAIFACPEEEIYDYSKRALERFSFFSRATLKLQRELGAAPDIFDCQECDTVPLLYYLQYFNKIGDNFFKNTRTVLGIHGFQYEGLIAPDKHGQAGLFWDDCLPGSLEYIRDRDQVRFAHLLKGGLLQAHKTYTRKLSEISAAKKWFQGIRPELKTMINSRFISPLWWDDIRSGEEEPAFDEISRFLLQIYELACTQSAAPIPEEGLPANIDFSRLSERHKAFYDMQRLRGRGKRINIIKQEELVGALDFFSLPPDSEFEAKMRKAGLDQFLPPLDNIDRKEQILFQGDLDRILSSRYPLEICTEEAIFNKFKMIRKEISIYEALDVNLGQDISPDEENKPHHKYTLDHIMKLFKQIADYMALKNAPTYKVMEYLQGRGDPRKTDERGIKEAAVEIKYLGGIPDVLSQYPGMYQAFIMGVILHDIGKCIDHKNHEKLGDKMLEFVKGLNWIFDKKQIKFIRNLVVYHASFGGIVVEKKLQVETFMEIFRLYEEKEMKGLFLEALYLLSIADMDSAGEKGFHKASGIKRIRKVYDAVITAENEDELKTNLKKAEEIELEAWSYPIREKIATRFISNEKDVTEKAIRENLPSQRKSFLDIGGGELTCELRGLFEKTLLIDRNSALSDLYRDFEGIEFKGEEYNKKLLEELIESRQKYDYILMSHFLYYLKRDEWFSHVQKMYNELLNPGGRIHLFLNSISSEWISGVLNHFRKMESIPLYTLDLKEFSRGLEKELSGSAKISCSVLDYYSKTEFDLLLFQAALFHLGDKSESEFSHDYSHQYNEIYNYLMKKYKKGKSSFEVPGMEDFVQIIKA